MRSLEEETCVRFQERSTEDNYVSFIAGDGCSSKLGMHGGIQNISLGRGCVHFPIVLHELIHALGNVSKFELLKRVFLMKQLF